MIELTSMEILMLALGALGLGMILLLKGGEWTIDSAVYVARHFGIPPLIIGFTIVAAGTSAPELIVSIKANLDGSAGIAIGNVIGSNIANILLIIGATAVVATLTVKPREVLRDLIMMMLSTILMMGLMINGNISHLGGGIMMAVLVGFIFWQYRMAKNEGVEPEDYNGRSFKSIYGALGVLLGGLLGIALGAEFLVRGAKVTAAEIGVPEDVIGLSVIALGTSLPELSTCVIAALRKQTEIVIGNIVGSNVFNILMIIGATALIKPIEKSAIAPQVITLDIWVMFGTSAIFTLILLLFRKINMLIGIIFMIAYVLYIALIYGLYLAKDVVAL